VSILHKIDDEIKTALKARDSLKSTLLRGLKSDIKYRQIDVGRELTEEDIIGVLQSAAKRRRDSIEQFKKGGRDDLVDKESKELELIEGYLPEQMSEDEIRKHIQSSIDDTGAESPAQLGQVMKDLMPKLKGQADGKLVNQLVREMLSGKED
jgi:uncharacterized protein YqeY